MSVQRMRLRNIYSSCRKFFERSRKKPESLVDMMNGLYRSSLLTQKIVAQDLYAFAMHSDPPQQVPPTIFEEQSFGKSDDNQTTAASTDYDGEEDARARQPRHKSFGYQTIESNPFAPIKQSQSPYPPSLDIMSLKGSYRTHGGKHNTVSPRSKTSKT